MSTNKTPFLNMHSWAGTDPVVRDEFNTNFSLIDGKAKSHDDTLNNHESRVAVNESTLVSHGASIADHASQLSTNKTSITNIGNSSPKGVYTTLSALQTAFPTGTTGIYVVTADGGWYYWSGTAWVKGGVYQSTSLSDVANNNINDLFNAFMNIHGVNVTRVGDSTKFIGTTKYIDNTGKLNSSLAAASDNYTDFIPVTAGNYYYYSGSLSGGGRAFFAFYTSNSETTFIASSATMASSSTTYNKLVKAPVGALYMRCSYINDSAHPFSVLQLPPNLISDINNNISSLQTTQTNNAPTVSFVSTNQTKLDAMVKADLTNMVSEITTFITSGYFLTSTGAQSAYSSSNITDYVTLTANTYYLVKSNTTDARSICFYDSNHTFLSSITGLSKGNPGYFIFNSGNNAFMKVSQDGSNPVRVFTLSSTNQLNNDLQNLFNPQITNLQTATNYETFASTLIGDQTTFTLVVGSYISSTGAAVTGYSGDKCTDFVAITPKVKYRYVGKFNDARAVAIYDTNKVLIRSVLGSSVSNNSTYDFIADDNAAYFRGSASDGIMSLNKIPMNVADKAKQLDQSLTTTNGSITNLQSTVNVDTFSPLLIADQTTTTLTKGYMNSDGSITSPGFGSDNVTDFIPISPNIKYEYKGSFSDGRCIAMYDSNKVLIWYKNGTNVGNVTTYDFISLGNAAYFRGSSYTGIMSLTKIPMNIKDSLNQLQAQYPTVQSDYTIDYPQYVFGIDNDSSTSYYSFHSREYVQSVYPESFLRERLPIMLDGKRSKNIQTFKHNTNNTETTAISTTIAGPGYVSKPISFNLLKTKASIAKGKSIRYMAIGDSMTDNNIPGLDGQLIGGGNYQGIMKQITMMDNVDFGGNQINLVNVGSRDSGSTNLPFSYNGQSYSIRSFDEGRGSWTLANYLRHAYLTKYADDTASYILGGAMAWDSLGLGRKVPMGNTYDMALPYETWSNTAAQQQLLMTTPHGKYQWDYTQALWDWLRRSDGTMVTTYDGTAASNTTIDTKMNAKFNTPDNPFFDKNIAKTTGDYAFSLVTYLNRYKTLADDGVTRLVVGSTAGSLITSGTLSTMDVCTPTHITLELGENDRWWYPAAATAQSVANDNMKLMQVINTEYPNIKVGFTTYRYMGPHYPENWRDLAEIPAMSVDHFKFDLNQIMQTNLGSISTQHQNYFIPTYHTMTPLSYQDTRLDYDLGTGQSKLVALSGNPNHPGIQAYWCIAYQVLGWIYYTLANS